MNAYFKVVYKKKGLNISYLPLFSPKRRARI